MIQRSDKFRIAVLASIVLAAMLLLTGKLWYVQVARGEEYTARIRNSSQVSVRLPAVRGEILDRHGIPLARNRASLAVEFYLPEMVRDYRTRYGSVPMRNYRTTVRGMMLAIQDLDVVE